MEVQTLCVRAVTLETLFTVTDPMVPEIRGFAKRSGNQNEVPDWRQRTKKSIILEKIYTILKKSENFKNKVSEIFKISEVFVQKFRFFVEKTSVSAIWPSRGLRTHGWFPKKILTVTRVSSDTALTQQ